MSRTGKAGKGGTHPRVSPWGWHYVRGLPSFSMRTTGKHPGIKQYKGTVTLGAEWQRRSILIREQYRPRKGSNSGRAATPGGEREINSSQYYRR